MGKFLLGIGIKRTLCTVTTDNNDVSMKVREIGQQFKYHLDVTVNKIK